MKVRSEDATDSGGYLVGNSENVKDKEMLGCLKEINKMNGENKKLVYAFLDAFITKTKLEGMTQPKPH